MSIFLPYVAGSSGSNFATLTTPPAQMMAAKAGDTYKARKQRPNDKNFHA